MECLKCKKEFEGRSDKKFCSDKCRNNFNNELNKFENNERNKLWYKNNKEKVFDNIELKMYNGVKHRAKKFNIPFNLDLEDIIIPTNCPLLNIPIYKTEGRVKNNTPSLDKINPSLGYVKGNVWVISWKANRTKSNLSIEELKMFCNNILKRIE